MLNVKISEAKTQILELQKPSKIEIQKSQLILLEKNWRTKQEQINDIKTSIENLQSLLIKVEEKKTAIEPLIREKRNDILGK
jgi:uncharacterized protein YlxW (UPF0749 family)